MFLRVRAPFAPAAGFVTEAQDMGWSFRIGRLAGIDIFVHFTFLILLGFIGLRDFLVTGNPVAALFGLGLTAAVFGIIVLHELGHALAARYYGIPTKDI